jgi:acyl-CoA thioesterase FadM
MTSGETRSHEATGTYRARFDECGPNALLRTSSLLRWAQDIAWIHSERLGYGREWYAERDMAWVVRGLELTVLGPIPMGSSIDVTTRVAGFRKVMARRNTEFRARTSFADGELLARTTTDWVMTDAIRGVPIRYPAEFPRLFAAAGQTLAGGFDPVRVDVEAEPPDAAERLLQVRPQDADPMRHANNAVYVDWLEECLIDAGLGGPVDAIPRTYRLEYLAAAPLGARVRAILWALPGGGARLRLVDTEGRDVLRAFAVAGSAQGGRERTADQ